MLMLPCKQGALLSLLFACHSAAELQAAQASYLLRKIAPGYKRCCKPLSQALTKMCICFRVSRARCTRVALPCTHCMCQAAPAVLPA